MHKTPEQNFSQWVKRGEAHTIPAPIHHIYACPFFNHMVFGKQQKWPQEKIVLKNSLYPVKCPAILKLTEKTFSCFSRIIKEVVRT
jgi:hypothetical protein